MLSLNFTVSQRLKTVLKGLSGRPAGPPRAPRPPVPKYAPVAVINRDCKQNSFECAWRGGGRPPSAGRPPG